MDGRGRPSLHLSLRSSGDRRYQQDFVSILKCVARTAEEADVLFVHVYVQEAPNLAGFVAQVGLQVGKLLVQD